jgi:hypothetical protein
MCIVVSSSPACQLTRRRADDAAPTPSFEYDYTAAKAHWAVPGRPARVSEPSRGDKMEPIGYGLSRASDRRRALSVTLTEVSAFDKK